MEVAEVMDKAGSDMRFSDMRLMRWIPTRWIPIQGIPIQGIPMQGSPRLDDVKAFSYEILHIYTFILREAFR
jgi:hypothetical protein